MPRYALLLAYDGTAFAGWWRQPDRRTVADEIDRAWVRLGERDAAVMGASRTDAGVHARGQLAHVDLRRVWDCADLVQRLSAHLPPDVTCRAAAAVAETWHAVHGVRRKTYRYRLSTERDPFAAHTAWQVSGALDPTILQRCADLMVGPQTWAAFLRRGDHRTDTASLVSACRWRTTGAIWTCDLTADRFIYRLVRSLVGGMILAARGGCTVDDWAAALAGITTPASTQQAPARGLCLERVSHRSPVRWQPARKV